MAFASTLVHNHRARRLVTSDAIDVKFGILPPYGLGPIEEPGYATAFARMVEEAGFESIWVVEHVVMAVEYDSVYPYDPSGRTPFDAHTVQPDPLIWLSHVAAATTRIRLATGVLILPQRNPLILAKELASLDRLSGGRVELGIGVGWVREEAEAVGSDFGSRGKRADEYVNVMRTLWREPVASFDGAYVKFDRMVSAPRPVQEGGVPIVVGGHSPAAARRAGRLGDGFFPLGVMPNRMKELRELMTHEADAAGRDAAAIEITTVASPDAQGLAYCRALGADRMIVAANRGDLDGLREFIDRFRNDVMLTETP
ncbi:MAG: LLM class F420-dependent oxidoreductase [Myxococcales bacterium]|jgi:probable F420-dependent oxidoreductase|nr:MAG: LLM class F420-dependent oxidoreductase [Myxococcales bacterium]